MAFECNFDFLSPEENAEFAAFVEELLAFIEDGRDAAELSSRLRSAAKELERYKAMYDGVSKTCEDMRREYKAFRDGVAAASSDLHKAGTLAADLERRRIETEDLYERLKCANAEIARLRSEADAREMSDVSFNKIREKYEKKLDVLERRLRSYKDYRARVARMAAMWPDDGALDEKTCDAVFKEEGAQ